MLIGRVPLRIGCTRKASNWRCEIRSCIDLPVAVRGRDRVGVARPARNLWLKVNQTGDGVRKERKSPAHRSSRRDVIERAIQAAEKIILPGSRNGLRRSLQMRIPATSQRDEFSFCT